MLKKLCTMLLLIVSFCSLEACVNMATTSAQVAYNHHSLERTLDDERISVRAIQTIYNEHGNLFQQSNINAATLNGDVLLTGKVKNAEQRKLANILVHRIRGVQHIYNFLNIARPSSALVRMSDAWLTTKIKSQFLAAKEIDATEIKVVTESGVVYLMGVLPHNEVDIAVDITRKTSGVLRVVKIFSYVYIKKT